MFDVWTVPRSVGIDGKAYAINTDYRDILEIIALLDDDDEGDDVKLAVSLALFYEAEQPPITKAWEALASFLSGGATETEADTRVKPKLIDWQQDASMICAEINKLVGYEIRDVPYMHWFTFLGYFHAIGEGQLATIVSIRAKRAKGKKLEDWEREFLRENHNKVIIKTKLSQDYLEQEAAALALLGE